ncbi:hypothetical protein ACUSIJ_17450 [Pseudochelatococcus sp. B33]
MPRGLHDACGNDETRYLDPLDVIADSRRTRAEDLLAPWRGEESVELAFWERTYW